MNVLSQVITFEFVNFSITKILMSENKTISALQNDSVLGI